MSRGQVDKSVSLENTDYARGNLGKNPPITVFPEGILVILCIRQLRGSLGRWKCCWSS